MLGNGGNGQDIVSMTERDKARRLAPLRHIEAYWHGLCDADQVPLRSQIDPRGMENALENAFLMERIAPSMAKIRVAGTHLNDLMGMQIAGMPISSLIAPAEREKFGKAVQSLFADPAVVRMDLVAESGFGKPELQANLIMMPLRSDFGDLSRGLGALVSHGKIGRTPRRFNIRSIEVIPALKNKGIVSRRPVEIPAEVDAAKPQQGSTLSDVASPLRNALGRNIKNTFKANDMSTETPARGHLRLVVSND
ncbi:MAG: PAS domain-containing protein [Pelagimonas sp.]|jgi:hypothetical protein|nr:PAS domain-containing protein [Pelagimonas sp.]